MKSTHLVGTSLFAAIIFIPPAYGQSSAELMQEGLNVAIEVASSEDASLARACEHLRTISQKIDAQLARYPQLSGLEKQLDDLGEKLCNPSAQPNPVTVLVPFNTLSTSLPGTIWRSEPTCNPSHGPIPHCIFSHENGRGLFALGQKGKESFPNFLLCALTAGSNSSLIASDYTIAARCLVSEVDWRSPGGRSDVDGLYRWLDLPAAQKPIELPAAIAQQCEVAFSDAAFCSPTMVVLPSRDPNLIDVCSLQTLRKELNVIVFRMAKSTSRWNCETKDLRLVDRQERLSMGEWECVPTMRGNISQRCTLPYLPTERDYVRYRELNDPDTPFNP